MNFLKQHHFLLFLIFLISLITVSPFITGRRTVELFTTLNYSFILLSGLYAFSMYRKFLKITFGIFLIAIILDWVHLFTSMGNLLDTTQPLFTAIVLVLLLSMTLKSIRAARSVDGNVIFGVLSGYVLIGYIGAFVSVALSRAYPGAYSVSGTLSSMDAVYYSFVTMTTLGYGDISPLIAQSRSLAILLSILGPMYVAIIVALMVGKFTASSDLKT